MSIEIVAAYDNNQAAVDTYNRNWDPVARVADLKLWRELDIPAVDGIIAGPPCQDASAAISRQKRHKPRGLNILYVETARIVAHKKPAWAIIENVQDMRRMPAFVQANEVLWNAGYWVTLVQLIHADFSGLTTRKRIFLVAARRMLMSPSPKQAHWREHGPALEPLLSARSPDGWGGWDIRKARVHECTVENATFGQHWGSEGPTWRAWDTPYFTVSAGDHARDKSLWNGEIWALNPQEKGVLQGFPADYKGLTFVQAGNAVPPEFAREWGRIIQSVYGKRQQVVSLFCGAGGFDFIQDV